MTAIEKCSSVCLQKVEMEKLKLMMGEKTFFYLKTGESQQNTTFEEITLYIYLTGWHSSAPSFSLLILLHSARILVIAYIRLGYAAGGNSLVAEY